MKNPKIVKLNMEILVGLSDFFKNLFRVCIFVYKHAVVYDV